MKSDWSPASTELGAHPGPEFVEIDGVTRFQIDWDRSFQGEDLTGRGRWETVAVVTDINPASPIKTVVVFTNNENQIYWYPMCAPGSESTGTYKTAHLEALRDYLIHRGKELGLLK